MICVQSLKSGLCAVLPLMLRKSFSSLHYHNIANFDLCNRVVKFMVENVGKTFSANSIVKFLKGEGRTLRLINSHREMLTA